MKERFERFEIKNIDDFMCGIINNCMVIANGSKYILLEIELYFFNESHKDKSVIGRNTKKAGEIFFHYWGIDICFKSNESSYGGVLVRSMQKIDDKENPIINGPLKCQNEILSNLKNNNITLEVLYADLAKSKIFKSTRIKGDILDGFDESLYRYYVDGLKKYYNKKKFDDKKLTPAEVENLY